MKDNFSHQSDLYVRFRPHYPKELYHFVFSHLSATNLAWDCGTGNGQVASALAAKFNKVVATDISQKQLNNASDLLSNVEYLVGAEKLPGHAKNSFDLITVAQAIHWFDLDKFYKEANRLGKPGSLLAAWGYGLLQINPEADRIVKKFYKNIVGPYWDPERKFIEERYTSIPFPFQEIVCPEFFIRVEWTLESLIGYFNTWSSVQKYITTKGRNPVVKIIDQLEAVVGPGAFNAQFPIFMRLGKIK